MLVVHFLFFCMLCSYYQFNYHSQNLKFTTDLPKLQTHWYWELLRVSFLGLQSKDCLLTCRDCRAGAILLVVGHLSFVVDSGNWNVVAIVESTWIVITMTTLISSRILRIIRILLHLCHIVWLTGQLLRIGILGVLSNILIVLRSLIWIVVFLFHCRPPLLTY